MRYLKMHTPPVRLQNHDINKTLHAELVPQRHENYI